MEMRKALRRDDGCPETGEFLAAMEDSANPRHRTMTAHAETCSACNTEWALYRRFEDPAIQPEEREAVNYIMASLRSPVAVAPERATQPWRKRILSGGWLGAAAAAMAAVVLTVGLGSEWLPDRKPGAGSQPKGRDSGVVRSGSVRWITPLGDVTKVPETLEWEPFFSASSYRIEVREVDGTTVFYKTITTPSLSTTPDVLKLLVPGKPLLIDVLALDAQGGVIAESGRQRIRIPIQ